MKIICIGQNYKGHIEEMGSKIPEKPVFFLKPDSALQRDSRVFFIPDFSNEIDYEVEIVLKISKVGKGIQPQFAHRYYTALSVGIDFTARDIQRKCKEEGLPWEISKAFDSSARLGEWVPIEKFENPQENVSFWLKKNGELVQTGKTADMIFNFDQIVSYVSQFMMLKIGDLIYTGTPAGVGSVKSGDRIEAGIGDKVFLDFDIR